MPLKRLIIIAATSLATVANTGLAVADESEFPLLKCRAIADDSKRLACYDTLAESSRAAQARIAAAGKSRENLQEKLQEKSQKKTKAVAALAPSSEKAPATQAAPATPAQPVFGEEDLPRERRAASEQDVELIQVNVVEMKLNAFGKALFYLENGQVWEQADRLRPRRYTTPFAATIRRAAMGSYMIQKDDSTVRMRVQRKK